MDQAAPRYAAHLRWFKRPQAGPAREEAANVVELTSQVNRHPLVPPRTVEPDSVLIVHNRILLNPATPQQPSACQQLNKSA
jgi:hypothetical protein